MRRLRPAEMLLKELGVTHPKEIDLEAIAFDQGADVKFRVLDGCEARIVGVNDRAVITVDDRVHPNRKRFSIAHELGHWHHHRGQMFRCRSDDINNPRNGPIHPERVADRYAADLLLPSYLFGPRADELGRCSVENLKILVEEFSTSRKAAAIKLVEEGPEPAMLVCHGPEGRRWFNRPTNIPDIWFPQDELDAETYAFDVLYGNEKISRRVKMGADSWFDRRSASRFELFEQSIKIADDEILTFLIFQDAEMLEGDYL